MWTRRAGSVAGLLLLAACREDASPTIPAGRLVRAEGASARSLLALAPDHGRAGEVFRPLPNGNAELIATGTGFTRSDTVFWNRQPVKTFFASSRTLGAEIPPALLEKPGNVEVTVEDTADPTRPKLRATFVVRSRVSP
jgi:hypothetical protein